MGNAFGGTSHIFHLLFSIFHFPFSIFLARFFFPHLELAEFYFCGEGAHGHQQQITGMQVSLNSICLFCRRYYYCMIFFFFDWLFLASLPRFSLLSHSIPWRKTYVHNPIEPSPICLVLNYLWYSFFFFFFSFFLIWLTPSTWRLSIDCLDPDFFGNSTIAVAKSSNLSTRPNTLLSTLVCAYQVPWPYTSSKMY